VVKEVQRLHDEQSHVGVRWSQHDSSKPEIQYARERRNGLNILTLSVTLDALRRFAVTRSLFPPTTLQRALDRLGFVQADPIRAPARAQDLTLRHRVRRYIAGDLERRYAALEVEEDVFINYGFVSRELHALMHPREGKPRWGARSRKSRAQQLIEYVAASGSNGVHPRDVDEHFLHGRVTNYWGGSSNATTHLLDDLHYRGLLRVVRREGGIRIYAARPPAGDSLDRDARRARIDTLVDVVVNIYAPLTAQGLSTVVRRLRYAVPQWRAAIPAALTRAKHRLARGRIDGVEWYWPADEHPADASTPNAVRLLAPFDPVVWDRARFETLWGWAYRFEAYTPRTKRKLGYYALPLLWKQQVIGWGNVALRGGAMDAELGFIDSRPREREFTRELDAELQRLREFLQS
jgi:uncharacterized protein